MITDELVQLPLLPLRDIVVFPHMIVPLFVGREKSVRALEAAMHQEKNILLLTQKTSTQDEPQPKDLYSIGTVGTILQLLKLPDGTVKVLVEGLYRARVKCFSLGSAGALEAVCETIPALHGDERELEAMVRSAVSEFDNYIKLNKKIPPEILVSLSQMGDPGKVADTIASHLALKIPEKQKLLETIEVNRRIEGILAAMEGEIGVLQVEKKIRSRVKKQMEKNQREYYLNEQMKAIQKEMTETEEGKDEVSELEAKIKKTRMTKEARERAMAEVKKLRMMSPMSAESTVIRNYVDWLVSIPWKKYSRLKHDIPAAEALLDKEHFGLEKVKERMIEYLAVQARTGKLKGPILCLVGPPGVGKTSLGKSIAAATGRAFVRMSVGGVRDESEIRGHRRTYIGSLPGKIIHSMKKAKTSNPLFLIDEIDKMAQDWRGDPASALLEVLDPEQNNSFNDHYLEVDYDLSQVMFVCTANTLNLPQPLLDRMEIIRISGYTEDEKVVIAQKYLLDKQRAAHGLAAKDMTLPEPVLRDVIRRYTREAGVRNLDRELAKLCRKITRDLMKDVELKSVTVEIADVEKYLGVPKYRFGLAEETDQVGATTGLAWTEVGGELLSIESVLVPGSGKITITGKLGDVMQESIQAALSFVKANSAIYGIKPTLFEKKDIHVHVPEGATPKDGPSAGIAICTSIVSLLTGIPVRRDIAMTGEITLRGRVLPIGGLKEKLLAALRGGIKTVLIPEENAKDLADVPDSVKKSLEIIPVKHADQVLGHALTQVLTPIEWDENAPTVADGVVVKPTHPETSSRVAH
ncbi:MAG: endopeptidase La [Holosporales bacterium]